jgi:glutaredoxin
MTGGLRETGGENRGDERQGVEVITFTLDGCHACGELKNKLREEGIFFRNISVDDNEKLGDALEREYLTEFYPIVQIVNKSTKSPYYTFVTESQLKGFKIVNWDTIPELVKKLKNILYEI